MFLCTSCGLCCQNISQIEKLKGFDLGDGICKYFDKQNLTCKIYETRPDICRVDLMFEKKYFKYYTKDEYFKLNIEACNKLQTMFDVDEKYRIKI